MDTSTELNQEELSLILELLAHERADLPAEVRRTITRSVREQLMTRQDLVYRTLEKILAKLGEAA